VSAIKSAIKSKKNLFEQWQLVLVLALALADDWH
jgi:hypothetical protein